MGNRFIIACPPRWDDYNFLGNEFTDVQIHTDVRILVYSKCIEHGFDGFNS